MIRERRRSPAALFAVLAIAVAVTLARASAPASPSIVVLVSLDGWRWDYLDRGLSPNLLAHARRGVRAEGLISSFPSKTFPSHYTIVTGFYPAHHGIISNVIADPAVPERFTMSAKTALDPRWWGGEPIWVTARKQGLRAAPVFWPGSQAPIGGQMPEFWEPFDDAVPNAERVARALRLLRLPEGDRPSFLTIYFSEVDTAGHDFGPDAPDTATAIRHLDDAVGQIIDGIGALGLADRTTIVFVSDHGMAPLSDQRVIYLDDYIDLDRVDVVDWTPVLAINPRGESAADVYQHLKGRHPRLALYRRTDMPAHLRYRDNPRIPPIIGLAAEGWRVTSHAMTDADRAAGRVRRGDHGYDPRLRTMQGLFVAAGPGLRQGLRVRPFENVHVYSFLCRVLGLTPAPNDGDPAVTRGFFAPVSTR